MDEERKPWDQRPEEPAAAYARFLTYRNLGPSRTLLAAYRSHGGAKNGKKRRIPGQWSADATAFGWAARADAWDAAMLAEAGKRCAIRFIAALEAVAARVLESAAKLSPSSWEEVLETIHALGQHISPDAVRQVQSDAADGPAPTPEPAARLAG